MSLEGIRALLIDAHARLQSVAHTDGARASLLDAIREIDRLEVPQDAAARYQTRLRADGARLRRLAQPDETDTLT